MRVLRVNLFTVALAKTSGYLNSQLHLHMWKTIIQIILNFVVSFKSIKLYVDFL